MNGRPVPRPSFANVERLLDEPLSKEAARAYRDAPVSDAERDEVLALVRWFRRRYPTGADRLAYVRRASQRWRRHIGR